MAGGLLIALDEGLWEADSRLDLEELREAVDARLVAEEDEVDTVGGLTFLLAGRILAPGESVLHPSGWRLESVDADSKRIKRVPVLRDGKVIGIVSRADLLRSLAAQRDPPTATTSVEDETIKDRVRRQHTRD